MEDIILSRTLLYEEPISPLIYGDFIEFLNDLIPGMWAEKVQDRCFEGLLQPRFQWIETNHIRTLWETFAAGMVAFDKSPEATRDLDSALPTVRLSFDHDQVYVGRQSAMVQVEADAGRPFVAGILQHGIAVRTGRPLRFSAAIHGVGLKGATVHVLLGRNYGAFFFAYARLEFDGIGTEWVTREGILVPDVDDDCASIAIGISVPGVFRLDKISLMPEDSICGWRQDVVQAVRAMKLGIIRFGGSSLIFYKWEEGVGLRDRRAPFENRPWGNREENDVGLHEFLELCENIGTEPLVCVNSNSATLPQVLDEIEYCNGRADSRWGSLRASVGHPEPFNVRYWQIGNEQAGERYERTLAQYAREIRRTSPELILMASYPSDRIISELSEDIDFICPHLYAPHSAAMESEMRGLIANVRTKARNPRLRIAVTEWNHTGNHWGPARAWLFTLFNALNAARMLNMYQRLGDMIRIANRSNLVNSCCAGVIQTSPSDLFFTPTYHVQRAYATLSGNRALCIEAGQHEVLDLSATEVNPGGPVVLSVVNSGGLPQSRRIELAPLALRGETVRSWTLAGSSLALTNSFADKTRVAPVESAFHSNQQMGYDFPPYSVTILRFD
jgi:alpha-L-arabinofuranosidase